MKNIRKWFEKNEDALQIWGVILILLVVIYVLGSVSSYWINVDKVPPKSYLAGSHIEVVSGEIDVEYKNYNKRYDSQNKPIYTASFSTNRENFELELNVQDIEKLEDEKHNHHCIHYTGQATYYFVPEAFEYITQQDDIFTNRIINKSYPSEYSPYVKLDKIEFMYGTKNISYDDKDAKSYLEESIINQKYNWQNKFTDCYHNFKRAKYNFIGKILGDK